MAASLAAYFVSSQALAQGGLPPNCGSRTAIMAGLLSQAGEITVGRGLSSRGYIIEVTASPSGGWSVIATNTKGISCMVDAGEAWQAVLPEPPPLPEVNQ